MIIGAIVGAVIAGFSMHANREGRKETTEKTRT